VIGHRPQPLQRQSFPLACKVAFSVNCPLHPVQRVEFTENPVLQALRDTGRLLNDGAGYRGLASEKFDKFGDDLIRRLFHKPVAGIANDHAFNVGCDKSTLLNEEIAGSFSPVKTSMGMVNGV
jgi:hypothetical protein